MNKKRFFLMKTALALFMALFSVWGWGQTETLTCTTGTIVNNTMTFNTANFTVVHAKGSDSNFASYSPWRVYTDNTVTFNAGANVQKITSIVITTGSTAYATAAISGTITVLSGTGSTTQSTGNTATATITVTGNDVKGIRIKPSAQSRWNSIVINYELVASGPAITATPTSLAAFTYIENNGPSAEHSFSLSGANLTNDIGVAAPASFEISKTSGSGFADNLSFTQTGGTVAATTVYARMKAAVSPATYSGNIGISSIGATTVNVAVSGTVTAIPVKPVITAPSSQTATVGVAYSYQIVASENPTAYAVASGTLPSGLNLNLTTGLISGTPTAAGTASVNVTASNAAGASALATIEFTIEKGTQTLSAFVNTTKYASDADFAFPASADNSGLIIEYGSSNPLVATVSGNIIDIVGVGTSTITATQAGDANWNTFNTQIVLNVNEDPVQYNGVGTFKKVTSLSDITDGYYVITDETDAFLMTSTNAGSFFASSSSNAVSDLISNPTKENVWLITTNADGKTIFNEVTSKYVGYTGSSNAAYAQDGPPTGNSTWIVTAGINNFKVKNFGASTRFLSYNASSPRFAAYTGSQKDLQFFKLILPTTWNGTTWSNGAPDANSNAIIAEDYNGPAIIAATLTIEATKTLTVNTSVKTGDVTNNGNIIVADNASFIQTADAEYAGAGNFTVNRSSASAASKYAFWSSPVEDQNMYTIFPGSTIPFVMTYNTTTDNYNTLGNPANAIAGLGYSIKTPTDAPVTATFNGVPNNGAFTTDLSLMGEKYNLVGNPYPSNLDLTAFNTANASNIDPTYWFWDNTSNSVTNQTGSTGINYGYATYNADAATWTPAPNTSTIRLENNAKVGQAFIVSALTNTLAFNNNFRVAETGVDLNKSTAVNSEEGKFWLSLTSTYNSNVTQAITYQAGASDEYDRFDSRSIGIGSDAFYSFAGAEKVIIQSKAPFRTNDVVVLGNKHFDSGTFTITLVQKEGLFTTGQAIYLKDKLTGTETNLQNGAYTFTSAAGEFADRFEIAYTQRVLGTDSSAKNELSVYRQGEDFVINSPSKINSVEVYDASGRLIKSLKANGNKQTVTNLGKGVYILHIQTATENVSKKVIK